jgi:hypothetical protein
MQVFDEFERRAVAIDVVDAHTFVISRAEVPDHLEVPVDLVGVARIHHRRRFRKHVHGCLVDDRRRGVCIVRGPKSINWLVPRKW